MGTQSDAQNKQRLSSDLATLWPGLRYLGLGVWLAWLFLAFSGTVWLSDVEIDGTNLSTMFLDVTAASAVTLLVAPFFKNFFNTLLRLRAGVMCGAFIAMLGGIAVILSGPYYIGIPTIFMTGNILMGIGSGILALKCGQLYGELQPQRALLYALLSQIILVLIFYFVVGNDFYAPVSGGPSLGGILSLIFLPLLAAYLITITPPPSPDSSSSSPQTATDADPGANVGASSGVDAAGGGDRRADENGVRDTHGPSGSNRESETAESDSIRVLPLVFWKFVFAILVFTFTTSIAQGYYTMLRPPSATLIDTIYVMLCRTAFTLGFMLLTIRLLKNIAFSKLYLLCMVFIAIAFAATPLLKIDSATFSGFIGFFSGVFDLLVWCLLALVVYDKRISSTLVFGFGRGVFLAGSALGWLLGTQVLHALAGTNGEMAFYIVIAFLILLSTTLIFTEKDFDRLFTPPEGKGLRFEVLIPSGRGNSLAPPGARRHERPWLSACRSLGERARLSSREQEILEMLALGRGNENIAQRLSISLNTVRTHTQNVYNKLDVHSRQELVTLVEAERDKLPT
jgi:DNA-binding CsgD family transcriptional regulator